MYYGIETTKCTIFLFIYVIIYFFFFFFFFPPQTGTSPWTGRA